VLIGAKILMMLVVLTTLAVSVKNDRTADAILRAVLGHPVPLSLGARIKFMSSIGVRIFIRSLPYLAGAVGSAVLLYSPAVHASFCSGGVL
jgi:hypothetical protein